MSQLKPYSFRHDGATYTFVIEPDIAEHASTLAGRKVYKDFEKCKVMIPSMGPPKQANSDLITQDWLNYKDGFGRLDNPLNVFHEHYDRWKAGADSTAGGTPLANLSDLTPGMIKTLEASKIDTLEALAQMDPQRLAPALGPTARDLVEKAKALTAPINPDVAAVRQENVKMKDTMEAQALQMEEMRQQIAAMQAAGQKQPKGKAQEAA
jgi:hypothetical protein